MGFDGLFYFSFQKIWNLLAAYLPPIVLENLSSQADANVVRGKSS